MPNHPYNDDEDRLRRKIDEQRIIFEAITKQWLDEKYAAFGRLSLKFIGAMVFVFLLKAIWAMNAAELRDAIHTGVQSLELAK